MILISAGTVHYPFNRLIKTSIEYFTSNSKLKEKVVIQTGTVRISADNPYLEVKPFFTLQEMIHFYQQAQLIISASGEASTHLILHFSKNQPVLFPRDPNHNEHIDSQQIQVAQELDKKKMIATISSESELVRIFDGYLSHTWKPRKINKRLLNAETMKVIELLDSITNEHL